MVTTAGVGTAGWVLDDMWVTGELDRNFIIIQTSSWTVVNIIGDCQTDRQGHYHTDIILDRCKHHRRLTDTQTRTLSYTLRPGQLYTSSETQTDRQTSSETDRQTDKDI